MDKKVEVFGFWWQVWEALDEDGEALCTKANFLWVLDIE